MDASFRSAPAASGFRRRWIGAFLATLVASQPLAGAQRPPFDHEGATTHRLIGWDDFRGKASRSDEEEARIVTAVEAAPLEVRTSRINKGYWVASPLAVEFYAAMDKRKSSVGRDARTDQLLAHEQGHFDLVETIARRLGRGLAGVEAEGMTAAKAQAAVLRKIEQAYAEAVAELGELQATYDRETGHGTDHHAQREWSEKIAAMLLDAPVPAAKVDHLPGSF